jgi:hypothetical protein
MAIMLQQCVCWFWGYCSCMAVAPSSCELPCVCARWDAWPTHSYSAHYIPHNNCCLAKSAPIVLPYHNWYLTYSAPITLLRLQLVLD